MIEYVLDARSATPHFPGIGRYVSSLARALADQLVTDERLSLLTDPRAPLHIPGTREIVTPSSAFSASQQWLLPRLLKEAHASVYHSTYYLMPYLPHAQTLLTVYDLIPLRHPEYSTVRARLLFRLATRLALRTASHVVAITETARRDFMREFRVSSAAITPIPLAAGECFRPQSQAEVARVRSFYHLPERTVLYLGSNKPHKNLAGLIRSWMTLDSSGASELVIAGAWDERYAAVRGLAGNDPVADGIRWLGPVPDADLPGLYGSSMAFVFPSFFEGFGLPVLEAMACGVPVICSNVSALPEVAGDAALLFDPGREGELAAALATVLDDPNLRLRLSERGLARAARYSWAGTAAATLALYRKLAGVGA